MPWKVSSVMGERLRYVGRLLDSESMSDVCAGSSVYPARQVTRSTVGTESTACSLCWIKVRNPASIAAQRERSEMWN
jgi:hypothetical protein